MDDRTALPRIVLSGSERDVPHGATSLGPLPGDTHANVTIVVRATDLASCNRARAAAMSLAPNERTYVSREALAQAHGASTSDLLAVERFAIACGLVVRGSSIARRSVAVDGTLDAFATAFGASLEQYRATDGTLFRGRKGPLMIPRDLDGIITGVFGLDDRPQARAQFRRAIRPAVGQTAVSYTPLQVAAAYDFPSSPGTGQTIALIELGGGYAQADLDTYFANLGIAMPIVSSVSVDGGKNAPTGDPNSADSEVLLDIEVAGAIVPGAKIVVYFAPNTDAGFLDAITTAVHDTVHAPQIISISWGGPESGWTAQALTAFDNAFADAAMLGMTVTCAAGDNGSSDGATDGLAHVDFPASSPHVLACGGTRLALDANGIASERVWNDAPAAGATGGGISDRFDLPIWQATANVPPSVNPGARVGRGLPDIAGDADPQSGYEIFVDGAPSVVGGTSAVAPLWAALVARLNGARSQPLGFLNPMLYANPSALRDIVAGNNGAYAAHPGWDACTGLGTPDGAKIAALFAPNAPT